MKQGQTFNVSRVEGVISIPSAMIKDRRLSFATEVLYGLLVKHSGSAGYCAVAQRKLAEEMGVSIILVRKAVAQLKRMKYIMAVQGGYHYPSRYYFLWRNEFKLRRDSIKGVLIDPDLHTRIIKAAKKERKRKGTISE